MLRGSHYMLHVGLELEVQAQGGPRGQAQSAISKCKGEVKQGARSKVELPNKEKHSLVCDTT